MLSDGKDGGKLTYVANMACQTGNNDQIFDWVLTRLMPGMRVHVRFVVNNSWLGLAVSDPGACMDPPTVDAFSVNLLNSTDQLTKRTTNVWKLTPTACTPSLCLNGGVCSSVPLGSGATGISCACPRGWRGALCEEQVTICPISDVVTSCPLRFANATFKAFFPNVYEYYL